ncbi:multiple sugar transport system permease protein [Saccharothrix coeruleofusca]|uniref:carbohydrate ABC transporter permease n=1 Tax=Saccharothrix coeruleofusca TaxID=33919 RepID=UPI001AE5792E|nr:sugar ABC transporter permease [Saccharothrix coeruleofusca]MBP2338868.1 multiple sugar transport system permease protein [Saccharothrix coeruleofusca]
MTTATPRTAVGRRGRFGDWPIAVTFLGPAVLAAVLLRLWPAARAVWDSLRSTPFGLVPTTWVGLDQYRWLFTDPAFLNSLKVTALFGIVVNPLQIAVALALAVLFNERIRGVGLMRTLVFLPVAIPQSVSAVIWAVAFRPDGPLNGVLALFGLGGLRYLTSPGQALASIVVVVSWIGVGYWMMFLIAGLKEIDPNLYDAAALDGAGRWARFRYVTVPQLRRQLAFVLVADTVSNLLLFAPVQILTKGGPDGSTDVLMNDIFERAYTEADVGAAAAATVVLTAVALAIVVVQFRLLSSGKD